MCQLSGVIFLRSPTLISYNFAAHYGYGLADLNLHTNILLAQKTDSIFKIGVALSKIPYFHSAYLLGFGTVSICFHILKVYFKTIHPEFLFCFR